MFFNAPLIKVQKFLKAQIYVKKIPVGTGTVLKISSFLVKFILAGSESGQEQANRCGSGSETT